MTEPEARELLRIHELRWAKERLREAQQQMVALQTEIDRRALLVRSLEDVSPVRTAEEARREPKRGDRWRGAGDFYTLTEPLANGGGTWLGCWDGETETGEFYPGYPGETYLGNFANELEEP